MNQPPTIPEGDEENEGVEPTGEGTRFPHTGASQQVPPMHDSIATAEELQPREDSGVGYGQSPNLQNEIIAVSGDAPTDASQQADYQQPSSVEHPEHDDQAKAGAPETTDAERELLGNLDETGPLAGIKEDEGGLDDAAAMPDTDRALPTLIESPVPPADGPSPRSPRAASSHDHLRPDETVPVSQSFLPRYGFVSNAYFF